MNKVSKSIKKFRVAAELTQAELADKLFVTRQTVSSWENGRTQPDIETLEKLSEALCVTIEELIYGEKPKTAEDSSNEKTKKTMITIFSVIASLLVGVGGVLVFFNYWSEFPHFLKTVFSVLPMLLGQAAAIFVFKKKYKKIEWREGAAVLWCAGIAATVALCDSVLMLSTDFSTCALIDLIMFLPVIYILDAVAPLIVYYALSIYYSVLSISDSLSYGYLYEGKAYILENMRVLLSLLMLFVLIGLGALYVFIHRKETDDWRRKYSSWITVIALIGFAIVLGVSCEEAIYSVLMSAFMILYAFKEKRTVSAPIKTLAPLGTAVVSVIIGIFLGEDPFSAWDKTILQVTITVLSVVGAAVAFAVQLKTQKANKIKQLYSVSVFALFLLSFCLQTGKDSTTVYIIAFILIMLQAASLIVDGAKEGRFFPLNVGLLTVIALICEILFLRGIDFLIVGFVMIFFGVCLFVINFRLAASIKKSSEEVKENE